jgi:hypothetical protein
MLRIGRTGKAESQNDCSWSDWTGYIWETTNTKNQFYIDGAIVLYHS